MDERQKKYMCKVMSGKTAEFINENFDYTVGLFDKTEEERLEELKVQATEDKQPADRPVEDPQILSEGKEPTEDGSESFNTPWRGDYMNELRKF